MADRTAGITGGLGWLLFLAGVLALVGFAISALAVDDEARLYIKLGVVALYGGLALLLLSVLRQQLIARKTDKYKDVQR
ncbi:MAG: hypothetical protein OXU63_02725 [Acidobacteriota bacterium]|nr:hypothetical protein [Acidobacteriota bacterium]